MQCVLLCAALTTINTNHEASIPKTISGRAQVFGCLSTFDRTDLIACVLVHITDEIRVDCWNITAAERHREEALMRHTAQVLKQKNTDLALVDNQLHDSFTLLNNLTITALQSSLDTIKMQTVIRNRN